MKIVIIKKILENIITITRLNLKCLALFIFLIPKKYMTTKKH